MKNPEEMSDDELFDEMKFNFNCARNAKNYNRKEFQNIIKEMKKRGFFKDLHLSKPE